MGSFFFTSKRTQINFHKVLVNHSQVEKCGVKEV